MTAFDLRHRRDQLWEQLQEAARAGAFDAETFARALNELYAVDRFWTFPGKGVLWRLSHYLAEGQQALIAQLVEHCRQAMARDRHRFQPLNPFLTNLEWLDRPLLLDEAQVQAPAVHKPRPYFEVLIVHPRADEYEPLYRQQLASFKSPHEEFSYDIVLLDSAEDALSAILANSDI